MINYEQKAEMLKFILYFTFWKMREFHQEIKYVL